MKNLSKKAIPIFLMVMFVVMFSQDLTAQTLPPPPPPPPPAVPIGGFIALGLVVGACFGMKKLKKSKKD